jgi:endonuclease YncB( thermonuclease family)
MEILFVLDDERIRFSGIDAPELKQTCLYQDIEFQLWGVLKKSFNRKNS